MATEFPETSHQSRKRSTALRKPASIVIRNLSDKFLDHHQAFIGEFIGIRNDCAKLEELEDLLLKRLAQVREERTILTMESEALGRRLRESG